MQHLPQAGGLPDFPVTERSLAQSGLETALEPVGLRPADHFQGCEGPRGRGARVSIRPGFDLAVYDLAVEPGATAATTSEPCLAIVILLEGEGTGAVIADGQPVSRPIPYSAGSLYVSYTRTAVSGQATVCGNRGFRVVEMRLSPAFLGRVGVGNVFETADHTHPLHHCSNESVWLGVTAATQPMLTDGSAIFADALDSRDRDLLIEARALRIFEAVVALMRSTRNELRPPDIGERQWNRLAQAHALMLSDLAHPWTIRHLARQVGLNEKHLKAGFKIRYGLPVHAFLLRARLEHARALIAQGDATVTEASLAIGYANPSHFARLFRRQFGVPPSMARCGAPAR